MQGSNFHTHTIHSDGTHTPREIIEAAIGFGFHSIGFSDHSYTHSREEYPMSLGGDIQYRAEIRNLAEEYSGRIKIYCGIEQDSESSLPSPEDYDYIISSVHQMAYHGDFFPLEWDADKQKNAVNKVFGGKIVDMAKYYFDILTEHVIRQKTDIVGHFDVISKFSLIPENDPEYISSALEAIREIIKHCKVFELNTGAIVRGYRSVPYPAEFMLDEIKRLGGSVVITSDCHNREFLTTWFDEGEDLLASRGFTKNERADLNGVVRGIEIWS